MTHIRLRTQLLVATLLIICGLTGALLLIIRQTLRVETQRQVRAGTDASVRAFESVQRQREQQLSRSAAMLADLPVLKAQMTTEHAPTIQDASTSWWKLAGSDLFILALPDRRVVAFHVMRSGFPVELAERRGWMGPDVWMAHAVHLAPDEVALLGQTRTGVAHCPSSNFRLGSGVAPSTFAFSESTDSLLGVRLRSVSLGSVARASAAEPSASAMTMKAPSSPAATGRPLAARRIAPRSRHSSTEARMPFPITARTASHPARVLG